MSDVLTIPDENEVRGILDNVKTMAPPERKTARAKLALWKTDQQEKAVKAKDDHFKKVYTDPVYFGELAKSPLVEQAASVNPDPENIAYGAANRAYLSHKLGRTISGEEFEAQRDGYAKAYFGKTGPVSDTDFYNSVKGQYEIEDKKSTALNELHLSAIAQALQDSLAGKETAIAPTFQAWAEQNRELIGGKEDSKYLVGAFRMYRKTQGDIQKFREPAGKVWQSLTNFTQGKASDEDVMAVGRELANVSAGDRKTILSYAALAAQATKVDRSAFDQVAKNLGESIGRSFDFLPKGGLAAQEDSARLWMDLFKSGNFSIREDEEGNKIPVAGSYNAGIGKSGYRAPSAQEQAEYLAKAEQAMPLFQIVRELRAVAREQIDPQRPIFDEGTAAGILERGAYGLTGSAGLMAATAVNPLVGVMAYRDEAYDRILVQNPTMDPGAARSMALAEGAGNALIDKLQLDKLPALAGLYRHAKANGWRGVREIGGFFGTQSAQELAQNAIEPVTETIVAALREDMADKDAGAEAMKYLQQIPETLAATGWLALIGGGLLSVRNVKNPMSNIDVALRGNGFSPEQSADIKSAKTPEEFDEKLRTEYPKRTAENIEAGKKEAEKLAKEAEAAQADPTKPTIETRTLADGTQEFTVTDAEGNTEITTADQQAAEIAYMESSRRSAEQALLAQEEAASTEESKLNATRQAAEEDLVTVDDGAEAAEPVEVKSETGIIAGSALEKWADEQIAEGRKRFNVGLDPVLLSAYSVKGAAIIERGVRDFAAWSAEMIANLGESIRPSLKEIYDESNNTLAAKAVKVPKKAPRTADRPAEIAAALDKLKKDPDERLKVYDRMKAKFAKVTADNRVELEAIRQSLPDPSTLPDIEPDLEAERQASEANIVKVDQNESASLDSLEAERAATIADIRADELADLEKVGTDIVEQYAHQIENAKTPERKASLKAQAQARESERRKGIQGKYTEKINRAEDSFRNQKKKLQDEAKKLRDEAKAKSKTEEGKIKSAHEKHVRDITSKRTIGNINLRREKMLQALGELDALLSVLPAEVRGKVGGYTKLAKIGTGEVALADFFVDRVAMIEKEMDRVLVREYSERINKVLERAQPKKGENRVKKSNIGDSAQEDVNFITEVIDLNEAELAGKIAELEALMAAATDPVDLLKYSNQWGLANAFGNIDARKAEDLAAAWQTLSDIVKGGRAQWKMREEQRLQDVAAQRKTALEELKVPEGVTDSQIQASKEKGETFASKVRDYFDSHLAWFQILGEVFGTNGQTASKFETVARKSSNAYTDATIARKKRFRSDMKKILKAKNLPDLHSKIEALSRPEFTGAEFLEGRRVVVEKIPVERAIDAISGKAEALGFDRSELAEIVTLIDEVQAGDYRKKYINLERVKAAGKRVEQRMSQLDAVHYLLSWDQADVREKMSRQGIDEQAINQLRKFVSPEAQGVMDWLRDRYAEGYDKISPVYSRLYGMKPPKIENYAPTFYDVKQADKSNMGGPTDAGATNSGMAASFIKARTDHGKPMARMNALEAYWRHSAQAEYWVAWAEAVREMRGVLGHDDVMRSVRAKYGQAGEKQIAGYMDAFENNGIKAAGMLSQISQLVHRQMSAGAVIALGYKISTLMKQTSAAMGSMLEIPANEAVRSMGRLLQGKLSTSLTDVWKSDTIQRRVEGGFSPEVRAFMAREGYSPSMLLVAAEYGMAPIAMTDAAFTTFSAAIAHDYHYRKALEMGMDETGAQRAAADKMDEVVKRTAQPAELADKSLIESHPGMKLFFMFLSEARQKAAISYLAAKQILRGENVGMNTQRLLVGWVAMGLTTQLMTDIYKDIFTDEEDEDIWKLEDYGRAALTGHLNGLFLVGSVASGIITAATGGHVFPDTQNPMARVAQNIQRKDFNPANWEDADGAMKGIQLYLDTIGRLAGSVAMSAPAAMMQPLKDLKGLWNNITTED